MKKPGAAIPRHPASTHIHLYVAGLNPSRRNLVMAQLFSPIYELAGALTQGSVAALRGALTGIGWLLDSDQKH